MSTEYVQYSGFLVLIGIALVIVGGLLLWAVHEPAGKPSRPARVIQAVISWIREDRRRRGFAGRHRPPRQDRRDDTPQLLEAIA